MTRVTVDFRVSGRPIHVEADAPDGPIPSAALLPLLRAVAEQVVAVAVDEAAAAGQTVSCRAGCGACCRQLVPISRPEAHLIADLVDALPEPRRAAVRARFEAARARLAESGLLERLAHPERFPDADLHGLGLDYFALGVACPFLEDESCSIYPERPLACREYLVTSPAEHCARPTAETVRMLPLAGKASTALARLDGAPGDRFVPWVPLILAPAWSEAHPEPPLLRPGPDLLRDFLARLAERPHPETAPPAG
jgi:Fe-S-cluster containining protein